MINPDDRSGPEARSQRNIGAPALIDLVRQFKGVRVAVLGDPMLDYYHFGHVDRLSPEAPVPIFIEDRLDLRDGGAGNVVANLRALGCEPIPLFPPAPYCIKHRYIVGSQQLFRIDRDQDYSGRHAVLYSMEGAEPQAALISDYSKGWCSAEACQQLIKHMTARQVPVIVDPKGPDWGKYAGADVICPNEREWEAVNCMQPDRTAIVAKHGDKGLAVITNDSAGVQTAKLFPARARQVFDVTGAGDTVVAVLAAALAIRCELTVAAELANIAAGISVGQVGTFPVSADMLIEELERGG